MSYRLDRLTFAMLVATALDAWTTYYFLSRNLGIETNPVLSPLVHNSVIWAPVCLFTPSLLIPFMQDVARETFAVPCLLMRLVCGLNNLGGILLGNYFVIDNFGFETVIYIGLISGVITFVWQLRPIGGDRKPVLRHIAITLIWAVVLLAIRQGYYWLGMLL